MSCCGGTKTPRPALPLIKELNATTASRLAVESGVKSADTALINKRISVCLKCTYFSSSNKVCNLCGCLVVAKVGKHAEACPARSW